MNAIGMTTTSSLEAEHNKALIAKNRQNNFTLMKISQPLSHPSVLEKDDLVNEIDLEDNQRRVDDLRAKEMGSCRNYKTC